MSGRQDDGRGGPSAAPPRPPVPPPVRAGGRPTAAPRPVARPALSVPAAAPDASPATPPAPPREADDGGSRRSPWAAVGLVLAAAATVAVFVTENALVLRLALLAVCWAVVGVTFLTGDRRGEPDPAREAELRQVADRAEEQAQWETRLHRDAEEAVRAELAQLRTELATVGRLRDELAGVQQLRTQLGALGQLREEVAALTRLRTELAEVGELRADIGRLRAELTEQLSGELFVERLVMRAQAVRGPLTGDLQTVGSSPTWA